MDHFNPRSPRGERLQLSPALRTPAAISIHAPREGSDAQLSGIGIGHGAISIHAPREGSDDVTHLSAALLIDFNPRSPRGERHRVKLFAPQYADFNPRSPRGERPLPRGNGRHTSAISIHAPREGSDRLHDLHGPGRYDFNPRSPRGERPFPRLMRPSFGRNFNPRSPRGERPLTIAAPVLLLNFNPRSPRGERRTVSCSPDNLGEFQSTLPARGATSGSRFSSSDTRFQSTLPARGATACSDRTSAICSFQSTLPARGATTSHRPPACASDFNPRSPRGERLKALELLGAGVGISIHAPREGSDSGFLQFNLDFCISIHAPREGSDTTVFCSCGPHSHFNPRSPRGERPCPSGRAKNYR